MNGGAAASSSVWIVIAGAGAAAPATGSDPPNGDDQQQQSQPATQSRAGPFSEASAQSRGRDALKLLPGERRSHRDRHVRVVDAEVLPDDDRVGVVLVGGSQHGLGEGSEEHLVIVAVQPAGCDPVIDLVEHRAVVIGG